jgi:hypothetical protein
MTDLLSENIGFILPLITPAQHVFYFFNDFFVCIKCWVPFKREHPPSAFQKDFYYFKCTVSQHI